MHHQSLEGQFLVAMPGMGDQRFEQTVILLAAHSSDGAMGFIINRAGPDMRLADFLAKLEVATDIEIAALPPSIAEKAVYTGGPVEPGRGFVLHSPDYDSTGTLSVTDDVSLTATLEILRAIAMGEGPERFTLALGYSGWSPGQLEEEITGNGWLVAEADSEIVFGPDDTAKYTRVMGGMGIDLALLSSQAGHA